MQDPNLPGNQGKNSPGVKKSTIEKLTANYRRRVKLLRKSTGKVEDYDPARDSKSIWFSKKAIDHLFKVNGCTDEDGLRLYFGVHDIDVMPTEYDDKLMVVLVATRLINGVITDQLTDEISSASVIKPEDDGNGSGSNGTDPGAGDGVNHGYICPPFC